MTEEEQKIIDQINKGKIKPKNWRFILGVVIGLSFGLLFWSWIFGFLK